MSVDRMHMKGHIDKCCKQNCDPATTPELKNVCINIQCNKLLIIDNSFITMQVDTEVCEQIFSWLSKYKKITQKMGENTFIFFLLYICDLHNMHEEEKLKSGKFM